MEEKIREVFKVVQIAHIITILLTITLTISTFQSAYAAATLSPGQVLNFSLPVHYQSKIDDMSGYIYLGDGVNYSEGVVIKTNIYSDGNSQLLTQQNGTYNLTSSRVYNTNFRLQDLHSTYTGDYFLENSLPVNLQQFNDGVGPDTIKGTITVEGGTVSVNLLTVSFYTANAGGAQGYTYFVTDYNIGGTGRTSVPVMEGWWLLPGMLVGFGIFARRRKE